MTIWFRQAPRGPSAHEINGVSACLRRLLVALRSGGAVVAVQRVPLATKLLARLLKSESVLLSTAAEPLFRCMMHLLPSLARGTSASKSGEQTGAVSAEQEAMMQALRKRSEEWASERLHAAVRGTRPDQHHPLNSASCGCLPLLQEWLYDSGVSHRDAQVATAAEAAAALRETLQAKAPLLPVLHLPPV